MQQVMEYFCFVLVVSAFVVGGVGCHPVNNSSEEEVGPPKVLPWGPFFPAPNVDNIAVWNILLHFEEIELHNVIGNESDESSWEYDPESIQFLKKFETTLHCTLFHLTSNTTINSTEVKSTNDSAGVIYLDGKKKIVIVETDNESFHVGVITKPGAVEDVPILQVTKSKVPLSRENEERIGKKILELGFKADPLVKVAQADCKSFKKLNFWTSNLSLEWEVAQ